MFRERIETERPDCIFFRGEIIALLTVAAIFAFIAAYADQVVDLIMDWVGR